MRRISKSLPLLVARMAVPRLARPRSRRPLTSSAPTATSGSASPPRSPSASSALGGALGQGRAAGSALEGIARNPQASGKIFVPMIVGLALIESLVIYGLLIAFQLFGKIG